MAVAKPGRAKARPNFSEYEGLEEDTMVNKIAHFLNWCAENRAHEFIPYNQIAFNVLGMKHVPRLVNREVVLIQKMISRVRHALIKNYKRSMVTARDLGVRATVDDADLVKTELAKNVRKLEKDSSRTAELFNLVDPKKLPDTIEFRPWKEWFNRQSTGQGLFKMITSKDWASRVALPASTEEKK